MRELGVDFTSALFKAQDGDDEDKPREAELISAVENGEVDKDTVRHALQFINGVRHDLKVLAQHLGMDLKRKRTHDRAGEPGSRTSRHKSE